ncbi:MAG: hypothetical protein C0518_01050 [Opitutus sp.]|nr:hypothetical protein [Opitutus sp.]
MSSHICERAGLGGTRCMTTVREGLDADFGLSVFVFDFEFIVAKYDLGAWRPRPVRLEDARKDFRGHRPGEGIAPASEVDPAFVSDLEGDGTQLLGERLGFHLGEGRQASTPLGLGGGCVPARAINVFLNGPQTLVVRAVKIRLHAFAVRKVNVGDQHMSAKPMENGPEIDRRVSTCALLVEHHHYGKVVEVYIGQQCGQQHQRILDDLGATGAIAEVM